MNWSQIVAQNVRDFIAAGGYRSVELFAHEHNIPKSTISRILNGKSDPRVGTLVKIGKALRINPAHFFFAPQSKGPLASMDYPVLGDVRLLLVKVGSEEVYSKPKSGREFPEGA